MYSSYDTAYSQLGVHLRKTKTYVHTKSHSPLFVAALFKIAKNRGGKSLKKPQLVDA